MNIRKTTTTYNANGEKKEKKVEINLLGLLALVAEIGTFLCIILSLARLLLF